MFSDIASVPLASHSGILTHSVPRSLRSVADTSSLVIEGRSIDIFTGALSLSLSPGRVLYTGDRSVTLSYSNQTTPTIRTISLDPHTGYEFSSPTEITTEGGQLYIIGAESRSRYTYSDELV